MVTRGTAFFRERRYRGYGLIYAEGGVPADTLRKRIGPARFAVALRRYAVANYGGSTGAEFRAAMDAASRVPLDDLRAPLPGEVSQ